MLFLLRHSWLHVLHICHNSVRLRARRLVGGATQLAVDPGWAKASPEATKLLQLTLGNISFGRYWLLLAIIAIRTYQAILVHIGSHSLHFGHLGAGLRGFAPNVWSPALKVLDFEVLVLGTRFGGLKL